VPFGDAVGCLITEIVGTGFSIQGCLPRCTSWGVLATERPMEPGVDACYMTMISLREVVPGREIIRIGGNRDRG
jgi:hypothetical protein